MLKKKSFEKKLTFLFNALRIEKHDNIIIHSNSAGISQFENIINKNKYNRFFKFIKNRIGKKGTILIPAYNYDFTKKKIFDPKKTPSQVGSLSNFLLKKYFKNRSNEPVFSHLIFGKLKKKLMQCNTNEAFGKNSIFAMMEKFRFKIICFCCPINTMTFLHYIEKKFNVKYRYDKIFKSHILKNNKKNSFTFKYFVGKKKYNYKIKDFKLLKLLNDNYFIEKKFGRFLCYSVDSNYLVKIIKKKITSNNYFLIK